MAVQKDYYFFTFIPNHESTLTRTITRLLFFGFFVFFWSKPCSERKCSESKCRYTLLINLTIILFCYFTLWLQWELQWWFSLRIPGGRHAQNNVRCFAKICGGSWRNCAWSSYIWRLSSRFRKCRVSNQIRKSSCSSLHHDCYLLN